MLSTLIRENQTVVLQGIQILSKITPDFYKTADSETFGASPGSHFRHVIQHYEAFFAGIADDLVDYDNRDRASAFESDMHLAARTLESISESLENLSTLDRQISILQNYNPEVPARPARTTISRELTFLISHTIHHYALIGVAMRLGGLQAPRNFGFAPSTLYYLGQTNPEDLGAVIGATK